MTDLFDPMTLRGVTLRNRIGIAPMCQYSCAADGIPTEWHLAHLLSRAVGGAGLIIVEASAVVPEGRITPSDVGIWNDTQMAAHKRLAGAMAQAGAVPGIQLAHAGRKASRAAPWVHGPAKPSWTTLAPSAAAFGEYATPRAMDEADIRGVIEAFVAATGRALSAGYRFVEIHAAHGYLLHQFLSPLSNLRNDAWGGDFAGRARLTLEVTKAVRAALPDDVPLAVRISHTDWVEGGWDTAESVQLSQALKELGVDLIDVSSGGNDPRQKITLGPGYQVPGAEAVRKGAKLPVAAVGLITEPLQAQQVLQEGKADLILIARASLRDPFWALNAARALGKLDRLHAPAQYERGWSMPEHMELDAETAVPLPVL